MIRKCEICWSNDAVRGSLFCEACTRLWVKGSCVVERTVMREEETRHNYRGLLSPEVRKRLEEREAKNRGSR